MSCLTTPTSNAVVERLFSSVTCVKNKLRNRLSSTMLDAIIRIRVHLQFKGKCCRNFEGTQHMLDLFNSVNTYKKEGPEGDEGDILGVMNMDC